MTAYADDLTLQRAKASQPFGYLVKPFRNEELRSTIEMALYKHDIDQKLKESELRYRMVSELTSDFAYSVRVSLDGSLDSLRHGHPVSVRVRIQGANRLHEGTGIQKPVSAGLMHGRRILHRDL